MKKSESMKLRNSKGITMIALVVTVVVILILAGISINAIVGDNEIIKRAKEENNNALASISVTPSEATLEYSTDGKTFNCCRNISKKFIYTS